MINYTKISVYQLGQQIQFDAQISQHKISLSLNNYKQMNQCISYPSLNLTLFFVQTSIHFSYVLVQLILLIIFAVNMRSTLNEQISHIERQLALSKQRLKSSPSNKDYLQTLKNITKDNCFNFPIKQYPFFNAPQKEQKIFKTTVNFDISNDKLQKLIKLNHPNLINIQKIARGHPKQVPTKYPEIYYSFYFQSVPFALKKIATSHSCNTNLLMKISTINIGQILRRLTDYLFKQGIFYNFRLDDIGVTELAEIKVYISPLIVCGQGSNSNDKKAVLESIDKLVGWWQTSMGSNQIIHPMKSDTLLVPTSIGLDFQQSINNSHIKSNKSSFISQEASQLMGDQPQKMQENKEMRTSNAKQSVLKNIILKNSNNSYRTELSKISTMQLDKMKKIDQQIKFIRERLKQKAKHRKHKQSDSIIVEQMRQNNKNRHSTNIFESARYQNKELRTDSNSRQKRNQIETNRCNHKRDSFQQNINCINIYTQPHIKNQAKGAPTMTPNNYSKPQQYHYSMTPNTNIPMFTQNIPQYHQNTVPDDFADPQLDESIDTYDMELDNDYDPLTQQTIQHGNYRHTVLPSEREKQISEQNCRFKQQNQKLQKKKSNQVINKHVTQSAGPLQFKNFVNNFIKPQFMAKKSNIYEDPGQYESENSKSMSRKIMGKQCIDLYDNGKSATSKTQRTQSNHTKPNKKQQDSNQELQFVKKNSIHRINSDLRLPLGSYLIKNQKSEVALCRKKMEQSMIGERVKKVLQKTKNAIALLNRVKQSQSPSCHYQHSPSI